MNELILDKIAIHFDNTFNCLENLIVDIARHENLGYEYMFLNSLDFAYLSDKKNTVRVGEKINSKFTYHWDLLSKYHGLCFAEYVVDTLEDAMFYIYNELKNGRYPIFKTNTFWCKWYVQEYQKIRFPHYCLIYGINDNGDFLIVDNQMAQSGAILEKDDFIHGCEKILTYEITQTNHKICDSELLEIIQTKKNSEMYEQMYLFSEDVKSNLDINVEFQNEENLPTESKMLIEIMYISRIRKQFALSIKRFAEENNNSKLIDEYVALIEIGDMWMSVYGMLAKAFFFDRSRQVKVVESISTKLDSACNREKEVLDRIANVILDTEGCNVVVSERDSDNKKLLNGRQIDISTFYNCKSISNVKSNTTIAEISTDSRYFYIDTEILEIFNLKYHNKLSFMVDDYHNDNISCFGQEIYINRQVSEIVILGCSDLGNHYDCIELHYDNKRIDKKTFQMPAWIPSGELNRDEIVLSGKGIIKESEGIQEYPFDVHLYKKAVNVDDSVRLSKIVLPVCPNIHIFSMMAYEV